VGPCRSSPLTKLIRPGDQKGGGKLFLSTPKRGRREKTAKQKRRGVENLASRVELSGLPPPKQQMPGRTEHKARTASVVLSERWWVGKSGGTGGCTKDFQKDKSQSIVWPPSRATKKIQRILPWSRGVGGWKQKKQIGWEKMGKIVIGTVRSPRKAKNRSLKNHTPSPKKKKPQN